MTAITITQEDIDRVLPLVGQYRETKERADACRGYDTHIQPSVAVLGDRIARETLSAAVSRAVGRPCEVGQYVIDIDTTASKAMVTSSRSIPTPPIAWKWLCDLWDGKPVSPITFNVQD